MFAIALAFVIVTTHVAAEIPSYIHVCGRKDPNLDKCILDNIDNLKGKICEGIPELDIPSNDPLYLDKLIISESNSVKLYVKNTEVSGLCDFTIKNFTMNLDTLRYATKISFNRIYMNTTYDFNIRILVPIAYQGKVYIITDNVDADVNLNFKMITKGAKRYIYLSKILLNLDIKDFENQYENTGNLGQLQEIIENFIGNNNEEIIKTFKPALEEAVSKVIISVANDIVKHFTYEELFPL
ncbi:protein takeout [Linepithema humile]|uniref:protein takeout n=1 Tax=Linepithema humile TaxID=83485 RepID=UPI0006230E6D|nr:PREDICTED: protein takeout-like [Linepithema humile]